MRYLEARPHLALQPYVKCYWFLEQDYGATHAVEVITPDGCSDAVFQLSDTPYRLDAPLLPTVLIHPLQHTLTLHGQGKIITAGIRFYPFGLYPFTRLALSELAFPIVDLAAVFGTAAVELRDQLVTLAPAQIFERFEAFLMRRFAPPSDDLRLVQAAVAQITAQIAAQPDTLDIQALAAATYTSERTLERKFLAITGASPKLLARLLRFNRLKNELMLHSAHAPPRLTDLAQKYSYFDQSHFIRDFRQFAGQPPSAFLDQVMRGIIRFNK
jgi:AraC-like DNA-binding protein